MRIEVFLEFWTVNRRGQRTTRAKLRKYERAIDAVKDAWQFRDSARMSERGVLTIQVGPDSWLRQRVRVDRNWLRPESWRTFKEILRAQQMFPSN